MWLGMRSRCSRLWKVGSISSLKKCHRLGSVKSIVTTRVSSQASQLRTRTSLDTECP